MKLSAGSPRRPGARLFGLEVQRAMRARGKTQRGFATEAGIGRTRLLNWISGQALPSVETAGHLADVLMWPSLVDVCRTARTRDCDSCGRSFFVESPTPQKYCSPDCKRFHTKSAGARRDLTRATLERRSRRLGDAIAAMCAACEPSGVCRTIDCPLQVAGVSPLPLARGAA